MRPKITKYCLVAELYPGLLGSLNAFPDPLYRGPGGRSGNKGKKKKGESEERRNGIQKRERKGREAEHPHKFLTVGEELSENSERDISRQRIQQQKMLCP